MSLTVLYFPYSERVFPETETREALKPYWKGKLIAIDLLVLTGVDQLLFIYFYIICLCYNASYINEAVNCSSPSRYVSLPWNRNQESLTEGDGPLQLTSMY